MARLFSDRPMFFTIHTRMMHLGLYYVTKFSLPAPGPCYTRVAPETCLHSEICAVACWAERAPLGVRQNSDREASGQKQEIRNC